MILRRMLMSFFLFILLTSLLNIVISHYSTEQVLEHFTSTFKNSLSESVTKNLQDYYKKEGSFSGVAEPMILPRELQLVFTEPHAHGPLWSPIDSNHNHYFTLAGDGWWDVVLVDEQGRILIGKELANNRMDEGYPITSDGKQLGTFWLIPKANSLLEITHSFLLLPVTRNNLLAAFLSSVIAFIFAYLVSRFFSSKIETLAQAAHNIAQGNLEYRVPVRSEEVLGKLAADFNTMADRLQKDRQLRRQLQADVVHELRTPLAVSQGILDSLESGFIPWDSNSLSSLQEEIGRMNRLVTDLHDLSKAETRQLSIQKELIYAGDLLERIEESFQKTAKLSNLDFLVDFPLAERSALLYIDPDRTVQIFLNLLHNAVRYTPAGGTIQITVRFQREMNKNGIELAVSDTGTGIAPEHMPHIFDRFYRGDQSRSRQTGGSGLGLAIAKEFVELQGGIITAKSTIGKGTTFYVWLPVELEAGLEI
ncbi:HAMP domain-containing protein [Heliobacillus mobilis]|uniref:histidine kinase n=1 Tax=Heliobacterium mobile TaxID=28064 RepID=A0A6I3SGJ2_HELMO|nr:ATP-binding protein [Heliobacterium mobile]MTV47927.1 HAMP domain-containing protein [Heliobacterium mobile]